MIHLWKRLSVSCLDCFVTLTFLTKSSCTSDKNAQFDGTFHLKTELDNAGKLFSPLSELLCGSQLADSKGFESLWKCFVLC